MSTFKLCMVASTAAVTTVVTLVAGYYMVFHHMYFSLLRFSCP